MNTKQIEAVYPLSPMQQGMLFHSIDEPESSVYLTQIAFEIDQALDVKAFERAWQQVVDRHAALRTSFAWKRVTKPLQVVHRKVAIPFGLIDWRDLSVDEQEKKLEEFLGEDRGQDFDLSKVPLMRMHLIRRGEAAYNFVWSFHHILMDGWSLPIVLQEVFSGYEAFAHGKQVRPESPAAYSSYIAWLQEQDTSKAEAYWRQTLKGFTTPTPLPLRRSPGQSVSPLHSQGEQQLPICEETVTALRHTARRNGLTLNTIVQGAWALLLSRYSGNEDIAFGATVSGRPAELAGVESIIGIFINTLPVRVRVTSDAPLLKWLGQLQEQQIEMRQFEYSPLVDIQQWSDVPRNSRIFESILSFDNFPVYECVAEGNGEHLVREVRSFQKSNYPLALVVGAERSMALHLYYDTTQFDDMAMKRLLAHLGNIVEWIAANPYRQLFDLQIMSEGEMNQQLVEWNQTASQYPLHLCLHELFESRARLCPNSLALASATQQLTYSQLDERASHLAGRLVSKGVGPEVVVGLLMERGVEMVVGMLAILKAGGAYLALDPKYPSRRLSYIVKDAGVRLIIADEQAGEQVVVEGVEVMRMGGGSEEAEQDGGTEVLSGAIGARGARVENLAYVIYTSGSTGEPKGVGIEHRGLVNLCEWHNQEYKVGEKDRASQVASQTFDASVWEIWPNLVAGASVHIAREEARQDVEELVEWMREEGITKSFMPTPIAEEVMKGEVEELGRMEVILVGGDRLRRRPRRGEGWRVVNHYGPTEGTVVSTRGEVKEEGEGEPTIGRPITNTQVYVLDGEKRPVPVGVAGELYISGAGLARGYINKADQTAERFLPNPYSEEGGGRMYRTGDVCRYRESGEIEYIGRADNQVKVRGYRIELGEVEAALLTHPAVERAVVVARPDHQQSLQLVGYLVASADESLDLDELRRELAEKLPDYMVPTAFVRLERLPVNANGKVDRNALPAPDEETSEEQGNYIAPHTPTEEIIAGIWAEVLGLERVSIHDDFLLLRGHSLLATQVISRVRMIFQVELPLRALFEAPTVAGLAATIDAAYKRRTAEAAPPIRRVSRDQEMELSYAQARLWFLDQLEPGSAAYNVPAGLRLTGRLETLALERSLSRIVSRHEALRTVFPSVGGKPVQRINPARYEHLAVADLGELDDQSRQQEVRRLSREQAGRPFDLAEGPVMRSVLVREGEEEHVLMVCMHHIVTDGWSIGVMVKELSDNYLAYSQGGEASLPELEVQYGDYAVWQREWLEGEEMDRQLGYWREQLAGAPMVLDVSADRARGSEESHRGSQYTRLIGGRVWEGMRELSRQEGVTQYMSLLAGFEVLMSRYSREEEMLIGTPIAGRNRAEVEGLIGFFVNTLVMRGDVRGRPSVREMLRRVRRVAMEGYANQDVPFERVVEEMEVERDLSRTPIFQVMFVMQNAPVGELEMEGLKLEVVEPELTTIRFDLTFNLSETAEGLIAAVEYRNSLFDQEIIARMVGHYERILEGMVEEPAAAVSALEMLRETERRQMLEEWNETGAEYPRLCIQHIYEQQITQRPEATAVISRGEALTYAELNERANQLAHHLMRKGVGPESRVGICVDRGIDMVAGLLGILKAGAAYIPLDPDYPRQRLTYMMEDSGVEVVITQSSLLEVIRSEGVDAVCLDREWAEIASQPTVNPDVRIEPDNLAYVIYTSGSTGLPKGVAVSHKSVARLVCGVDYVELGPQTVILQMGPLAFDASTFEIWGAVLNGGRCVVMGERVAGAQEIGRAIREQGVNTMWMTASLFNAVVDEGVEELRGVRQMLVGGEALSERHIRRGIEELRDTELINGYGPTEGTTFSCSYKVREWREGERIAIGRAITNTQVYVLDRQKRPVPVGVAGELYISGAGLARGYINKADQTAERFLPNPYSEEGGGRMYRTGDVCRYRESGEIEYIGRADNQVKVRGYRIELGEVEAALMRREGVRQAVVIVREEEQAGKRLVAYMVEEEGSEVMWAELRQELRKELPEYMVPAMYVKLEQMPLTPNGKNDRRALIARGDVSAEQEGGYVTARTPTEEIIAGIWAEVLGLERVSIHDDFFVLGGHSLLATQVISRVRMIFQVELPLRALFEAPTVAGLASTIDAAYKGRTAEAAPPIRRVSRDQELELSYAQQRLWFLDQLEPGSAAYNVPAGLRLTGRLDTLALERSLSRIVSRHEALRTVFPTVGGKPVQRINPARYEHLAVADVSELDDQSRQQEVRRLSREQAGRPFELSEGPVMRSVLIREEEEEHVLMICMHHIVTDGWSIGVMVKELAAMYEAYSQGGEASLPELEVQYADYTVWQREWLEGEEMDRQLGYWREQLAGAPVVLDVSADRARGSEESHRGSQYTRLIGGEVWEGMKELSRQEGVTLYMSLLAGFEVLMSRYSGEEEMLIGTPIAGRNRAEVEGLIGFFVNTLVMRGDVRGRPSVREMLRRVRRVAMEGYANQDVPFEKVVEEMEVERDLSRTPIFQVMFVMQNAPVGELEMEGLKLEMVEMETQTTKFDLTLSVAESAEMVVAGIEYKTELFEERTIERMMGHYERILEGMVEEPAAAVSALEMLRETERRQMLEEWNETGREYASQSIAHIYAQQVTQRPEALAVVSQSKRLSYEELNERANQLAHHLMRKGVGPESRVGICVDRGIDMAVGLLGILKAGAAYVPLDPEYPRHRLSYMLSDAVVEVVLTHSDLLETVVSEGVSFVCLDREWAEIASQPTINPDVRVEPDNLAYVIYTSGSTGLPKGVGISQKSLINLVTWHQQTYHVSSTDRATQIAALGFDASVWEIWPYLLAGASLHIAGQEERSDPKRLMEWMVSEEITISFVPTVLAEEMMGERWAEGSVLRSMLVGGDRLRRRPRRGEGWRVVNHYGPTEGTVVSTRGEVKEEGEGEPTIGRPIWNTQVYVLDGEKRPVPVGVAGELYISGAGLARGYINKADQTAERFLPNPYSVEVGGRMYRTGDVCRYREGGEIEYIGRADNQVKVRGYRIELGEVEAALMRREGVRQAVVIVREEEQTGKRLVAYVVEEDGSEVMWAELRQELKQELPEYMVPAMYVKLEQMPLTPNGKVDRKALPVDDRTSPSSSAAYQQPSSPAEIILAQIWQQVLGVEKVGVNDNFFELGGDSILSIQVVARANEAGLSLSPKQMFQHQTIGELARVAGESRRVEAEQGRVSGDVELTAIQEWFFEWNEVEVDHWNQSVLVEMKERVQGGWMREAVRGLLEQHDVLRSRYEREGGRWRQEIKEEEEDVYVEVDMSEVSEESRREEIERVSEQMQRSLRLTEGPIVRVGRIEVGDRERSRMVVIVHHLGVDGVSWRILLEDLERGYRQAERGEEVRLGRKTTSWKYWANKIKEYAESDQVSQELSYWLEDRWRRNGELPRDNQVSDNAVASASSVIKNLTVEETRALLTESPQAFHAHIDELLVAALVETLMRWMGSRSILVDVEGHGREELFEEVDLTKTVGWFTTIYPLSIDLSKAHTLDELVKEVKEVMRSVPNKGMGYGLLKYLRQDGDVRQRMKQVRQSEVSFNYLGQFDQVLNENPLYRLGEESTGRMQSGRGRRRYIIEVTAQVVGGQLQVCWIYSRNLHKLSVIEGQVEEYLRQLRLIIAQRWNADTDRLSPTDFPRAKLSQKDLSKMISKLKGDKRGISV